MMTAQKVLASLDVPPDIRINIKGSHLRKSPPHQKGSQCYRKRKYSSRQFCRDISPQGLRRPEDIIRTHLRWQLVGRGGICKVCGFSAHRAFEASVPSSDARTNSAAFWSLYTRFQSGE